MKNLGKGFIVFAALVVIGVLFGIYCITKINRFPALFNDVRDNLNCSDVK